MTVITRCGSGIGSQRHKASRNAKGFSLLELVIVILVVLIILTEALPSLQGFLRSYRAAGDAKRISSQLALARMRSAANFTEARLHFNVSNNSYQLETYNKTAGQFQQEGGAQNLTGTDSWGFGNVTTPAGAQTAVEQPAACLGSSGQAIAGSYCILFNSRGVPVDTTGAATCNDVVYLTDGSGGYFSVAVSPSGRISVYRYIGSSWIVR